MTVMQHDIPELPHHIPPPDFYQIDFEILEEAFNPYTLVCSSVHRSTVTIIQRLPERRGA